MSTTQPSLIEASPPFASTGPISVSMMVHDNTITCDTVSVPVENTGGDTAVQQQGNNGGITWDCPLDTATLSVLRAPETPGHDGFPIVHTMTKTFYLDAKGDLQKLNYTGATYFDASRVCVDDIGSLGKLIQRLSRDDKRDVCIIRGVHADATCKSVRRADKNFREHPDGSNFVMLDIDSVPVPEGIVPHSVEAINWLISIKLPPEFRGVTCFYQFSSSSGICKPDGSLLKPGLCAHIFFYFDKRVSGKILASFLKSWCIATNFYTISNNKGGVAAFTYGIDPAPIRSAVQPHYVAHPVIKKTVTCLLTDSTRDGFIKGERDVVQLPEIAESIIATTQQNQNRLMTEWKEAHGYKRATMQVHTSSGVVTTSYYKPTQAGTVRTGRIMIGAELSDWKGKDDICILILDDENSPGSWFVLKVAPHLARRRDGTTVPLIEFSESAYAYVSGELGWLIEVPHRACQLLESGHLPEINTFATAKHSLILAPTGSGKTYRMTEWMAATSSAAMVIYVAQTIPLVNQMSEDLNKAHIRHHHYHAFNYHETPRTGIFLTTNESLWKILKAMETNKYVLVVDEFHRALDDFTRSDRQLKIFKDAITQADRVVYMTGTLTTIQRGMLSEIVGGLRGRRMTESEYCCYEFASVKRNPLQIRPSRNFGSDAIGLLESYAELLKQGKPIPRTVLIMGTSRMMLFNLLFEKYGLADQVRVVSRPESTPREIEEARTTTKPILVTSPLFSIGLNFEREPEVLWCGFDSLQADTSQINQTINRGNRGGVACKVSIYAGSLDKRPFYFPPKKEVMDQLRAMLDDESDLSNFAYDMPLMLDRMSYNQHREIEKNTNKSLGLLMLDQAFQNYVISDSEDAPEYDEDKRRIYAAAEREAREIYDDNVLDRREGVSRVLSQCGQLENAKAFAQERRDSHKLIEQRTEREIEDDELALIMEICDLVEPAHARRVALPKLHALFGTNTPWLSDSRRATSFTKSYLVSAGKVGDIIYLIGVLGEMASGNLGGEELAAKFNKDKRFQKGFLALAISEANFVTMQKSFQKLAELRAAYRESRSAESELVLEKFEKALQLKLLGEIGVFFEVDIKDRYKRLNMDEPVVPKTWDIPEMVSNLENLAGALKILPDQEALRWSWSDDACRMWESIGNCVQCKFFYHGNCLRGNYVDFTEWGIESEVEIEPYWKKCNIMAPRKQQPDAQ
jgi:hypothetical protein